MLSKVSLARNFAVLSSKPHQIRCFASVSFGTYPPMILLLSFLVKKKKKKKD